MNAATTSTGKLSGPRSKASCIGSTSDDIMAFGGSNTFLSGGEMKCRVFSCTAASSASRSVISHFSTSLRSLLDGSEFMQESVGPFILDTGSEFMKESTQSWPFFLDGSSGGESAEEACWQDGDSNFFEVGTKKKTGEARFNLMKPAGAFEEVAADCNIFPTLPRLSTEDPPNELLAFDNMFRDSFDRFADHNKLACHNEGQKKCHSMLDDKPEVEDIPSLVRARMDVAVLLGSLMARRSTCPSISGSYQPYDPTDKKSPRREKTKKKRRSHHRRHNNSRTASSPGSSSLNSPPPEFLPNQEEVRTHRPRSLSMRSSSEYHTAERQLKKQI